jgi:hypothetical protein
MAAEKLPKAWQAARHHDTVVPVIVRSDQRVDIYWRPLEGGPVVVVSHTYAADVPAGEIDHAD